MRKSHPLKSVAITSASFAKRLSLGLAATGALLALAGTAKAQTQVYSQDFENTTTNDWIVNVTPGEPDTVVSAADFHFDYSTVGIPPAPHTTDGSTHGLKLINDCGSGPVGLPAISVCPIGFGISENFDMHADVWLNYNGAGVAGVTSTNGGSGSTEFGGMGYGTAGTSVQGAGSVDSIFCGVTTDGGSSADYRLYTPDHAGSYQNTDTNELGYVYAAQNRNASDPYYTAFLPATPCPPAQTNLYPQQTGLIAQPGTIAFAWHDMEIKKIANTITFLIDDHLIATAYTIGANGAGTPAGTNIVFLMGDINSSASADVEATNLLFTLFDNVRITNFPNIVSVSATQPYASEAGPTPGEFTITRTSSGQPLTVNYTMSGTATNGANYQMLSGSVTFAATALSTNITLTPIDDGVPEATMTAVMTIAAGTGYAGGGFDTVYITDNDTPAVDISVTRKQAYDRYADAASPDYLQFHLNRRGLLSSELTVNLTYSGTAVGGTDYAATNAIDIPSGAQAVDFEVYPIRNPAFTGNQTVTVGVASGTGYTPGTGPATGTIVDSDYAPATVLLSDPLTNYLDASNWVITYGTGDPTNNSANYNVDFGFDTNSAYGAPIPPPPGGAEFVLHETCNKNVTPGAAGAVNAYYTNVVLSGDYAVRFNMNLVEGDSLSYATEGAVFGINHTGTQSNWWYGSGPIAPRTWGSDGIWYFVCSQAAAAGSGDYQEFTGAGGTNGNAGWTRLATRSATSFADAFKNATPPPPGPFTSIDGYGAQSSGIPANAAQLAYDASTWSDVEIKQIHNIVTMSINKTPIFVYTNNTVWKSGYLMLGYSDPYSSVGAPDGSVYYANLQVVRLSPPEFNSNPVVSGGNVTLTFSSPDSSATFIVQSAADASGPWTDMSPQPVITSQGDGTYTISVPQTGAIQLYRIRYQ